MAKVVTQINPRFSAYEDQIFSAIEQFDSRGFEFHIGDRNIIKLFDIEEDLRLNIKSFKIPNFINRIVYRYLRKSKSQRSYEYARRLLKVGIDTPTPIAYLENYQGLGLNDSYYASIHQPYDFTMMEVINMVDHCKKEKLLRKFSQFTYAMHQAGIEFKDHSPGNTLIKKMKGGKYKFYLVDLNRMRFHESINIQLRMKTFARLTLDKKIIGTISDEYSNLSDHDPDQLFQIIWRYTSRFYKRKRRRQKIKNRIKSII